MKVFFDLPEMYDGLRARRLSQVGRLVLYQIINDGAPYWLVIIRNFDPGVDVAEGLINPDRVGTWRFVDLKGAETKFGALAKLPRFIEEEARAEKSRDAARQRMRVSARPFVKKEN